jgi:hypothetical protein
LVWALSALDQHDEAIAASTDALAMSGRSPRILAELASIHSRRGQLDAVRGILAELEGRASKSLVEQTVLGSVHACLGEMAEARRLVAFGIEQHEIWWQFAKSAARAPFRADAEGAGMLRTYGFA